MLIRLGWDNSKGLQRVRADFSGDWQGGCVLTLQQGRDSSQGHSETAFRLSGADEFGCGSEVMLSQGKQVILLCLCLTLHTRPGNPFL